MGLESPPKLTQNQTFQKTPFTFHRYGANSLYKGVSTYPHLEFAFTSLSHRFHIERTRFGDVSVKAM